MRRFAAIVAGIAIVVSGCNNQAGKTSIDVNNDAETIGYALGQNVGMGLQAEGIELDAEAFVLGFRHAQSGAEPLLDAAATQAALQKMQQKLIAKRMQQMGQMGADTPERSEVAEANAAAGAQFLAENAKAEGVQTLASGLQIKIIAPGEGEHPTADSVVLVHYEGRLLDGTVFDSSIERGQPAEFPLKNVIPGWTEGLQLLKPGGKATLYIPPELAYGARGAGGKIGPNQTLIFDVELLAVK